VCSSVIDTKLLRAKFDWNVRSRVSFLQMGYTKTAVILQYFWRCLVGHPPIFGLISAILITLRIFCIIISSCHTEGCLYYKNWCYQVEYKIWFMWRNCQGKIVLFGEWWNISAQSLLCFDHTKLLILRFLLAHFHVHNPDRFWRHYGPFVK